LVEAISVLAIKAFTKVLGSHYWRPLPLADYWRVE